MRHTIDAARIVWVLAAALVAAGSATSNPPPQAMPPQQPYGSTAASAPAYGPCEYACGQISRCQITSYDACVAECRQTGAQHQAGGRERLDDIARSSCDQIATAMRETTSAAPAPLPATSDPYADPPVAQPPSNPRAPSIAVGSAPAGRWISTGHASYTNPAMVGADLYLDVTVAADGAFHGSWARYLCGGQTYGIWSCHRGASEGAASGRLDASGTGSIELERLGRSTLASRRGVAWGHTSTWGRGRVIVQA